MNPQQHSPKFLSKTGNDKDTLFAGLWIRWQSLTVPERVVCANIILLPAWWAIGLYRFMALFLLAGIFYYEKKRYGGMRFKKPTFSVAALFAFCTYRLVGSMLFGLATEGSINISGLSRFVLFWYGIAFLLWYVQSNNIKVRVEVAAWACSALVLQMIVFWLIVRFIFGEGPYVYPQTLYSMLTGNASGTYEAGEGLANFLIPYRYKDRVFGLFARWSFYFLIPEILALVVGFIILLALDLKNRLWSILLFVGAAFLLLISGTRSVWLTLPLILSLRYLFIIGRTWGYFIPLALLSLVCFVTLSFPPVTNTLISTFEKKSEDVGAARADSTKVRGDIYRETIKHIPDKPIFGHWVPGPTVLPGFDLGRVGTHSFVLGTLLYRTGLVGALLFLSFWVSLFIWFYETREGRPLSGYGLLILYTLASPVMEFGELVAWMLILLGVVVRSPKDTKSSRKEKWKAIVAANKRDFFNKDLDKNTLIE